MFMHRVPDVSWEVRSFIREFDLGRFHREKMGHYDMNPIAEQDDEIYDDSWFINRTRLFPNIQFAMLDQVAHTHRRTGGFYSPKKDSNCGSEEFESPSGAGNQSAPGSASRGEREPFAAFFKIHPVLFSANRSLESDRFTLLRSINTSNLMYLDLSYTKRDSSSVHILPSLNIGYPNLRVLKLRGLRMIDAEFSRLRQIRNSKLWSLDIRDNRLTDAVVNDLISGSFMLIKLPAKKKPNGLPDLDLFEDVPDYQRVYEDRIETVCLRPDDTKGFVKYIEEYSSFPSINDQILDDNDPLIRQTGLTHLYISNNRFTSQGVEIILNNANRLQVFDVGCTESVNVEDGPPAWVPYQTSCVQVGSSIVQDVSREVRSQMQVLRIHHSFVTHVPTIINPSNRDHRFALPMVQGAEAYGINRFKKVGLQKVSRAFSPLQNYRLTHLTLTDIPTKSYGFTIERLIELLSECRIQEERLDEARNHIPNNRRAPQLLPGLRTLRLEFLPEDTSAPPDLYSVSGDTDAANFHASSEGDFSFFEDKNTMSSVSRRGSAQTIPQTSIIDLETGRWSSPSSPVGRKGSFMSGGGGTFKRAMSSLSRPGSSNSGAAPSEPPAYVAEVKDVVMELKRYRTSKEGKWSGDLQLAFPYSR